ncbi:MAG: hypothetical protein DCF25_15900 [Leptolyngbya foveolarum]|uniref:Sulfotransferase domain-containing protein n=1 Tax=Leptolyngbya foveolarum TaxID=47253 RepID=A0A2W4U8U6_9CYAN|nr:MAG: hypothetical protein DCF25_15900 [Leptolyngbya foveolarum]
MPNPISTKTGTETVKKKIEAALHQAQLSCRTAQWSAVISVCESAIAQAQQCLESEQAAAQNVQSSLEQTTTEQQNDSAERTAAVLYQAKGDLFKSQGDLTAAIAAYQKALALAPETSEVATALGEAYLAEAAQLERSGDVTAATQSYLQALTQSPYLFTAYSRLRYNLLRYNIPRKDPQLQDVIETCKLILAKHPNIRPARITLGYALTKAGHLPAAIDCYRTAGGSPEEKQRRPPDFIIVGAEKSGTTSLHQYLKSHPHVVAPIEKEIDFFDLEYGCGLEWYLSHFPPASGKESAQTNWITGETSANYLYSEVALERVFEHFPQIKLVAILRDPVDRTVSRYNMMVRNGAEKRSFKVAIAEEISHIQQATTEDAIDWRALNQCRHVGNSLYYHHLKRWLALFSRQQLLVLQSEDLFSQPQQTMQQFYRLLGLDSDRSPQKYPQHNAGDYQPADADVRQQLSDFFAPHNRQLEILLNQSFHWQSLHSKAVPAPATS